MPQVRIKTDFGEIVIPYNDISELQKGLNDIDKVIETVNTKFDLIKPKESLKVKQGFEDIYTINHDGTVSILKSGNKTENIGIVLFAYDPAPLKVKFVAESSGVIKAKDIIKDPKYFERKEYGSYKLNADGLKWITSVVIPKLRETKKSD